MESMPATLHAYRAAMWALTPLAPLVLRSRAERGKEELPRLRERLGYAHTPRPSGCLIWIHGASVGECVAALPLIESLLEKHDRSVLVTSGTVSSARMMAERLPPRALHQYAPVDIPAAVSRFLEHWKPDVGLFIDSEIWPNMLSAAHTGGVKLALVNGRMSMRAFRGWRRAPRTAATVLSLFRVCLAQDEETAARLETLGARNVVIAGSLKADAPPLPVNEEDFALLSRAVGDRPILLAASTHAGEEETILPAHDSLRQDFCNLLTIVVPRHPERGGEIAMLCGPRAALRRSDKHIPGDDTAIYIADTLGELGLFYRLASFAFLGGSLVPHGGQNPLEAAQLGRAVMAGPHTENFARVYEAIFAAQSCGRVCTSQDIADFAHRLFADRRETTTLGESAASAARSLGGALQKTLDAVEAILSDANA